MGAYYDVEKDKIVGCKPGSYAWDHEERHRWQYKTFPKLTEWISFTHINGYYGAIISAVILFLMVGLAGIVIGIGMGMLPYIALTAALEADAYVVGTAKYVARRFAG